MPQQRRQVDLPRQHRSQAGRAALRQLGERNPCERIGFRPLAAPSIGEDAAALQLRGIDALVQRGEEVQILGRTIAVACKLDEGVGLQMQAAFLPQLRERMRPS